MILAMLNYFAVFFMSIFNDDVRSKRSFIAFSETNKPYISKQTLIILTKQETSRTRSWYAKRVKVSGGIL